MADAPPVDVVIQIRTTAVTAGRLWSHRRRGAESATFVYDDEYLSRPDAYALDPALPLAGGQHQTPGRQAVFGALSDSAPDRWGRRLIARAERQRARLDLPELLVRAERIDRDEDVTEDDVRT